MRNLLRLRAVPACLIIAAATACGSPTANESAGNEANATIANDAAPAAVNEAAANEAAPPGNAAEAAAEPYRASGTEPFWSLAIGGGQMVYHPMEGPELTAPTPAQQPTRNGYRYVTPQLSVEVVHMACNNGMSEETFADTVHLRVNGETLNGCGGQGDGVH